MKEKSDSCRKESLELRIEGEVSKPVSFTVADLRKMQSMELHAIPLICYSGRVAEKKSSFKGVLLRDLLERASIRCTDEKKRARLYLVAHATDKHTAVFSFHEVFNSPARNSILAVYEKNGSPISSPEGMIALLAASDLKTCCRYLKAVNRIEVIEAD